MSILKNIINFEEFGETLGDGIKVDIGSVNFGNLESLLQENLEDIIDLISKLIDRIYIQKSEGITFDLPAIEGDYEKKYVFNYPIKLAGIAYSQTGWKDTDCFSLYVDDELIFDKIYTKELGQYKHFNVFLNCNKIKIIYHNNSGNSKLIWFDIDYLQKR